MQLYKYESYLSYELLVIKTTLRLVSRYLSLGEGEAEAATMMQLVQQLTSTGRESEVRARARVYLRARRHSRALISSVSIQRP